MNRLLPTIGRVAVTLIFVVLAVIALFFVWQHYEDDPWTRDGIVQADSVEVSADVSGLVSEVNVRDNQCVRRGDVLFTIDRTRYAASYAQSDASVQSAQASVKTAAAKVISAKAALDNAVREERRYVSLGNLVSAEDRDQKITTAKQKYGEYQQSLASVDEAGASVRLAVASRKTAELNLERSSIRASVEGLVTNFKMLPGDYVMSGSPQFALLDVNSFHVLGYLEETKLHRFNLGDRARVNLLGDSRPIQGRVISIAGGITDRQRSPSTDLLPNIMPTFSWIRLAQRIPIRVQIDELPADLRLVAGRTATVTILPGTRTVETRPAATTLGDPNAPSANPDATSVPTRTVRLDRPCGGVGT